MKNTQLNNLEIRKALLTNPKLAFKTYFDTQLDDIDVKVVTNTKSTSYFVMPDSNTDLSDLSSIQAAAGSLSTTSSVGSAGTVGSVTTTTSTVGSLSSAATVGSANT